MAWTTCVSVGLTRAALWDLLWRPETQAQWLGDGHVVELAPGARCVLADEAGLWRIGDVLRVRAPRSVVIRVHPAASWGGDEPATTLMISIAEAGPARSVLRVTEGSLPEWREEEVTRFWAGRLWRARMLVNEVRARREHPRQAVVVIHGIGEQLPGVTLANLVNSGVLGNAGDEGRRVRPDRGSRSFELRRVNLSATRARPTTDVYELYWAHLVRDTTLRQVLTWMRRLLFRRVIPPPLRRARLMLIGLVVLVAVVMLVFSPAVGGWVGGALVVAGVLGRVLAQRLGRDVLVNVIGDAARYLSPVPDNIAHRQAIREAGVDLLERLHDEGSYDRIVVLGHSLGSVIAYDVLTHAWIRMNTRHRLPGRPRFGELRAVERAAVEEPAVDPELARTLQFAAWRRSRTNTQPWLVTDLVTVGSPLTYGDFLLAANREAFARAQADRVLPMCPPVSELKGRMCRISYERPYRAPFETGTRTFTLPHHAALFAVTRWSNLFFEASAGGLRGDIVGGPVAPVFGAWIRDVPLRSGPWLTAHTSYWRSNGRPVEEQPHLLALRTALGLDVRQELESVLSELPPSMQVPA